MIDYNEFFSMVEVSEDEKASAMEYIDLRGLQEHIEMANYLSSFIGGRKPMYKEVATAFRYDKRIRRILYKYIGLIEEYYRSYLCNNFSNPLELGIRTNKSLYEYLCSSLFSSLIRVVWSLGEEHKKRLFENKTVLRKNLDALVYLRNAVSHNRTIVTYLGFGEVTLSNGEIGQSLLLNVKNMIDLIPIKASESCVLEIISASKKGGRKRDSQVDWKLIESIVLRLE